MNHSDSVRAAEERLLDAALAQHFASASSAAPPATTPRWLLAALVLLGIVVTAATMWQTRTVPREEAQDPQPVPLPAEVTGSGVTQLQALPVDTENLLAKLVDPRDLPVLKRFPQLRGLRLSAEEVHIAGINTRKYHPKWSAPADDLLTPIAALRRLESLSLPSHRMPLGPALLAPFADHPTLRELTLTGHQFALDEALVAALAKIPRLRGLDLHFVAVTADTLRAVATLPLESIELRFCHDLDADGWQALMTMRSLRSLSFTDWSWGAVPGRAKAPAGWRPTPVDLRHLSRLPQLRELELLSCDVDDEQFAALPDTLTTLRLASTKLTPNGIGALGRFVALRELRFDTKSGGTTFASLFEPDNEPAAEAFAAALTTLKLRSLFYRGALLPAVANAIGKQADLHDLTIQSKQPAADTASTLLRDLRLHRLSWQAPVTADLLLALAKQPDLHELELAADDIADVAALATAPRLLALTLTETSIGQGVTTALLAPLASSKSLGTIAVNVSIERGSKHPTEAELQRAVGDRIRVRLKLSEFGTGKR
jgi:hypothetical protein